MQDLYVFTLKFIDDFPVNDAYDELPPQSACFPLQDYELDDVNLSRYGIGVLGGTLAELRRMPAVKENLKQTSDFSNGAWYHDGYVTFEPKYVALKLLMLAESITEFWQNYDVFLHDLTKINHRILTSYGLYMDFECYYKNCSVKKFVITENMVWFEFDLTLCFTAFRIDEDHVLLAAENETFIKTEDNKDFIEMRSLWDYINEDLLATEDDNVVFMEHGGAIILTKYI